jgi:hypothetical protein
VDDNTFFLSYTGAMKTLTKTAQVIDHYGGNRQFAKMLETTHQNVSNWRSKKKFPANTYVWLRLILSVTPDISVPDSLWNMRHPKRKKR